jgi:hypothetical protein
LGHGAHPSVSSSDDDANPRRLPHSFFRPFPHNRRLYLTRKSSHG